MQSAAVRARDMNEIEPRALKRIVIDIDTRVDIAPMCGALKMYFAHRKILKELDFCGLVRRTRNARLRTVNNVD
jgi:hypothetical protein